ncbi:phBC6A51 family helix-turn-helix protein [Bacillus sp. JJ1533]|uniref:phBC6A51 family helix-turn-helix protein n=1 Tax=Bacillus sp. JJ1533 TaxID=3122959 RepID=UPI002FFE74ED
MYYLALPKSERWALDENGNKVKLLNTYQDIADYIGVHLNTLYSWRKDGALDERDLKKEMLKHTTKHLPEVLNAIKEQAVKGSGKHAELFLKMHEMLTDKKEVRTINEDHTIDIDKIKERAMQFSNGSVQGSVKEDYTH